ncbi:MAG: hypothetical protein LBR97_02115 [Dysgonamonadaceae bacterium]|jgi:hypothetical protein|nr:hypothetical protein [Dysgonamonadaceae bacterium]
MNKLKYILLFTLIAAFSTSLSAQNFLSKERENEIKTSEHYYWGECSDFQEDNARVCAFDDLKERVIGDAVKQSIQQDEALKAIDMGAHFDRLEQKGKIKILAWIAKDSVFVTSQKTITRTLAPTPTPVAQPVVEKKPQPQPAPVPAQSSPMSPKSQATILPTDNPILQELAACKNYKEVRRVATIKGLVRGSKINSSEGFTNPAKCIIAVFTTDGTLSALLDTGSNSRVDVLSGKTVQNPEQHYNKKQYSLWYLQQK